MNNAQYFPTQDYPIDSVPIDTRKYIKAYKSAINNILCLSIDSVLNYGHSCYKIINNLTDGLAGIINDCDPEVIRNILFYVADIGLYEKQYHHSATVLDLINNHPNIAITDIDKALLGCIFACYTSAGHEDACFIDYNYKELLYSYVFFLQNVQRYELITHMTIDLSKEIDEAFVYKMFLNPMLADMNSQMIELSDSQIRELEDAVSYRKKVKDTVSEARINEKEYELNEQNQYYWEQFITLINYRLSEESRVAELITSDVDIKIRLCEFEKYIKDIFDNNPQAPGLEIDGHDLLIRYEERYNYAYNYIWAETDSGEKVLIEKTISSIVDFPYTFNCVLIAYHLFLIKPTADNLWYLAYSLCCFIIKNVSQIKDVYETVNELDSSEKCLIYTISMIKDYYEKHNDIIDSLRYEELLNDESLSGFNFNYDVLLKSIDKIDAMKVENANAFCSMDLEEVKGIVTDFFELSNVDEPDVVLSKFAEIMSVLPNKLSDVIHSEEIEVGNCIIHSINAMYILVKTIDRALDKGLIKTDYIDEIKSKRDDLHGLEGCLVGNTYKPLNYLCYENVDIGKYRLNNGIDATNIEKLNEKLYQRALFDLAKTAIQDLHSEINNLDFKKACQIKEELRNKMNDYPDCELKEQIYELVDQETHCLCDALMINSSCYNEFEEIKVSLNTYIGKAFDLLPDGTINALTTAELLYSQYATTEYLSANFDYSCISVLYYQAFESLYNELLWSKYADKLNRINENGEWFSDLYYNKKLPANLLGYLPSVDPKKYMNKTRIASALTMGSFNFLLHNITSASQNSLPDFRLFFDKTFGYDVVSDVSEEYKTYQKRIDELHDLIKKAIPHRNAASHGQNAISLEECKADKKIVLSDLDSIRNNYLGLIMQFLLLYKEA